ncbi:MAG: CPBP family glutamic-type intramembrane protease [Chloroflexota bacterium]
MGALVGQAGGSRAVLVQLLIGLLMVPFILRIGRYSLTPSERGRRGLLEAVPQHSDEAADGDGDGEDRPYLDIVSARTRLKVIAVLGLLALGAAEVTVAVAGVLGTVMYGVLTLGLLMLGGKVASRRLRTLLWALAIIPTSRLVAFGAPLDSFGITMRMALVGGLTVLAAIIAVRATGMTRFDLGLTAGWRQLPFYLLLTLAGLVLGVAERLLAPSLPYPELSDTAVLVTIGILGLADDLVFQGVILEAARRAVGRLAVPYVALVIATLHIGYGSWPLVLCAFAAAALFGAARTASRSIVSAMLGHLGLNVGLLLLGPGLSPVLQQLFTSLFAGVTGRIVGAMLSAITSGGMV